MPFNLLQYFTPKDRVFFPLFEKLSENLSLMSVTLVGLLNAGGAGIENFMREIERHEQVSDELAKTTLRELGLNFITPFDREDIHNLVTEIADTAGFIYNTSKKIGLYKLGTITPEMLTLGQLISAGTREIDLAVRELRHVRNHNKMQQSILQINKFESEGDLVFEKGIERCFKETDAIQLIKYKDVLTLLEIATDKCENVANVLETIMIKNA